MPKIMRVQDTLGDKLKKVTAKLKQDRRRVPRPITGITTGVMRKLVFEDTEDQISHLEGRLTHLIRSLEFHRKKQPLCYRSAVLKMNTLKSSIAVYNDPERIKQLRSDLEFLRYKIWYELQGYDLKMLTMISPDKQLKQQYIDWLEQRCDALEWAFCPLGSLCAKLGIRKSRCEFYHNQSLIDDKWLQNHCLECGHDISTSKKDENGDIKCPKCTTWKVHSTHS